MSVRSGGPIGRWSSTRSELTSVDSSRRFFLLFFLFIIIMAGLLGLPLDQAFQGLLGAEGELPGPEGELEEALGFLTADAAEAEAADAGGEPDPAAEYTGRESGAEVVSYEDSIWTARMSLAGISQYTVLGVKLTRGPLVGRLAEVAVVGDSVPNGGATTR